MFLHPIHLGQGVLSILWKKGNSSLKLTLSQLAEEEKTTDHVLSGGARNQHKGPVATIIIQFVGLVVSRNTVEI